MIAEAAFDGRSFSMIVGNEIDGREPWSERLLIAHSRDQSMAINPANVRSRATFGTSMYPISASDMA